MGPEGIVLQIIVATEPTELLFTEGKPELKTLPGTELRYVTNSENVIIHDQKKMYVLLSVRWFSSISENGEWTYIPTEKLPADLSKIPVDSKKNAEYFR